MYRAFCLLIASIILGWTAWAQEDGPFGFIIGDPISDYECEYRAGIAYLCKPPKSHVDFDSFYILATPQEGICIIKAASREVSTSGFGIEIRTLADAIAAQISRTYGNPTKRFDRLLPGSIWDGARDWMMAINRGDRIYAHYWENVSIRRINAISVDVHATSSASGWLAVQFEGDNAVQCKEFEDSQKADVF